MNNIFRHIEYLLLRHDCVIVPGFGAFIATEAPARIDRELGIIIPPSRTVMFNQSVMVDDGLLANSIARKENLSFEESRQVILKAVENIKSVLLSSGRINTGALGEIVVGEEQTMLFKPSALWNQGAQQLGFTAVKLPLAKQQHETKPAKNRGFISRFSKIAAAVAAIAVIALAAFINPLSPSDFHEERASVVPVEVLVNSKKTVAPAVESKTVATADSETVEAPATSAATEEPAKDRYYLIVGTFTTSREAERFAKLHSSEEYKLVTVPSRRVTRVALASADTKEELLPMLNSKEIAGRFPSSWIWSE